MRFLELRIYDFWLRGKPITTIHRPDPAIVIIALDEESFRDIKEPFLLWMPRLTRMIQMLHNAGASVIGLDLLLQKTPDEFFRYGTAKVLERAQFPDKEKKIAEKIMNSYHPHFDNELGLSIRETHSVFACMIEERSGAYLLTNSEISDFAGMENMGSAIVYKDIDGVIRMVSSHWTDVQQKTFPTFSFLIASRYLRKEIGTSPSIGYIKIPLFGPTTDKEVGKALEIINSCWRTIQLPGLFPGRWYFDDVDNTFT